jgi:hypothetical protein
MVGRIHPALEGRIVRLVDAHGPLS